MFTHYPIFLTNMGHQTKYKKCKKCGGIIIITIAFEKKIISTNCNCNKNNKKTHENSRFN